MYRLCKLRGYNRYRQAINIRFFRICQARCCCFYSILEPLSLILQLLQSSLGYFFLNRKSNGTCSSNLKNRFVQWRRSLVSNRKSSRLSSHRTCYIFNSLRECNFHIYCSFPRRHIDRNLQ